MLRGERPGSKRASGHAGARLDCYVSGMSFVHAVRSLVRPPFFAAMALLVSSLAVGCTPPTVATATPEQLANAYPTVLQPPASLGADFMMEQEVTMTHAEGQNTFRAILQKRGDELVLLGLAPHGGRAFVLTQRGDEITFESFMPEELPFPPRYILHDIHRTWFQSAGDAAPDANGWREVERDGERIREHVGPAGVTERHFTRLDGVPAGTIVVRYGDGLAAGAPNAAQPPTETTFENGWFGYTGSVRTLSWEAL